MIKVLMFEGGEGVTTVEGNLIELESWTEEAVIKYMTDIGNKSWLTDEESCDYIEDGSIQTCADTVDVVSDNLIQCSEDINEGGMYYFVRF